MEGIGYEAMQNNVMKFDGPVCLVKTHYLNLLKGITPLGVVSCLAMGCCRDRGLLRALSRLERTIVQAG
jgi:hypothetical protein